MTSTEERARHDLRDIVLAELKGGLWHTTRRDYFERILSDGAILPGPNIPNSERWKTSGGEEFYPYVRTLGGVSLFDFDGFESESYSAKCPSCSWDTFVPWREDWGSSVWIEIDRQKIVHAFVSGTELLAKQKTEGAYRHTIMPYIEAAYIGQLPTTAFKRAFLASPEGMEQLAV